MTVLIAGTILSLVGIAIIPTYEADAKECNNGDKKTNDNNDKNNKGNDDTADSTACTDKKDSNDHENSATAKDTTPFFLPIPFP
jgi:hypothetical protein